MAFTPSNTSPLRVGQRVKVSTSHPHGRAAGQLADVTAISGTTVNIRVLPPDGPAFPYATYRRELWTVRGKPFAPGHDTRQRQRREAEAKAVTAAVAAGDACPACGAKHGGTLQRKHQRRTGLPFLGCSRHPSCTFTSPAPTGTPRSLTPPASQPSHPTTPEASAMTAQPQSPADAALAEAVRAIAATVTAQQPATLDAEAVGRIATEALAPQLAALEERLAAVGGGTRTLVVQRPEGTAKVEGAHAALADLVEAATVLSPRNLYVAGPAGSGKTTLAAHLAEALGLPFALTALSGGATEGDLLGRTVPNLTTGERTYTPSPFVTTYRDGGVILLDEVDGADANVLLALNAALANGHMTLPTGERVERHPDCVVLVAANTFGTGAGQLYVGRAQLDAAFLDRFAGATFFVDYDKAVEAAYAGCPASQPTAWLARLWAIRDRIAERRIRRVLSTRAVIACARWVAAGKTHDEALRRALAAWSKDDCVAVGEPSLFHGEGR